MSPNRAKKISIYLPGEHLGALASRAETEGVSLSSMAAQMIERGLFQTERIEGAQALETIRQRIDLLQSAYAASDEKQLSRIKHLADMINKILESRK
jgi:hypothetical protein